MVAGKTVTTHVLKLQTAVSSAVSTRVFVFDVLLLADISIFVIFGEKFFSLPFWRDARR